MVILWTRLSLKSSPRPRFILPSSSKHPRACTKNEPTLPLPKRDEKQNTTKNDWEYRVFSFTFTLRGTMNFSFFRNHRQHSGCKNERAPLRETKRERERKTETRCKKKIRERERAPRTRIVSSPSLHPREPGSAGLCLSPGISVKQIQVCCASSPARADALSELSLSLSEYTIWFRT